MRSSPFLTLTCCNFTRKMRFFLGGKKGLQDEFNSPAPSGNNFFSVLEVQVGLQPGPSEYYMPLAIALVLGWAHDQVKPMRPTETFPRTAENTILFITPDLDPERKPATVLPSHGAFEKHQCRPKRDKWGWALTLLPRPRASVTPEASLSTSQSLEPRHFLLCFK